VIVPELQEALRNQLYVLNQVYALKRRLRQCQLPDGTIRPLERIEEHLAADLHLPGVKSNRCGLVLVDPLGQPYDDRRTELDAEVIGAGDYPLFVVDVLKPIIRLTVEGKTYVVQRGSVTVAPQTAEGERT
jgi:hypothetical protein